MKDSKENKVEARLRVAGVSRTVWTHTLPELGAHDLRDFINDDHKLQGPIAYVYPSQGDAAGYDRYRVVLETVAKELVLSGLRTCIMDYVDYRNAVLSSNGMDRVNWLTDVLDIAEAVVVRDMAESARAIPVDDEDDLRVVVSATIRMHEGGKLFVLGGDAPPLKATELWPRSAHYNFTRAVRSFTV